MNTGDKIAAGILSIVFFLGGLTLDSDFRTRVWENYLVDRPAFVAAVKSETLTKRNAEKAIKDAAKNRSAAYSQ